MKTVLEQIQLMGVIPVVVIDDEDSAEPLARALAEGGLPCMEITFRTAAARRVINRIGRSFPSVLLGAGTVLTPEQVTMAVDAGARFIVSPGLIPRVVEYCLAHTIPVFPGIVTPTEIGQALEFKLDVLKFFPAEASGGLSYLKAISAPFNNVRFIPTGGIDETNLASYLRFPKVVACGGSWMVKQKLIADGKFGEIKQLASRAVEVVLASRQTPV